MFREERSHLISSFDGPNEYGPQQLPVQRPEMQCFRVAFFLSIIALSAGVTLIVLESVTLAKAYVHKSYYTGFWSGGPLIISGIVGTVLLARPTNQWAMAAMITDSFALVGCCIGAVFGSFGQRWPVYITWAGIIFEIRSLELGVMILNAIIAFIVLIHAIIVMRATCACCRKQIAPISLLKA